MTTPTCATCWSAPSDGLYDLPEALRVPQCRECAGPAFPVCTSGDLGILARAGICWCRQSPERPTGIRYPNNQRIAYCPAHGAFHSGNTPRPETKEKP